MAMLFGALGAFTVLAHGYPSGAPAPAWIVRAWSRAEPIRAHSFGLALLGVAMLYGSTWQIFNILQYADPWSALLFPIFFLGGSGLLLLASIVAGDLRTLFVAMPGGMLHGLLFVQAVSDKDGFIASSVGIMIALILGVFFAPKDWLAFRTSARSQPAGSETSAHPSSNRVSDR